MTRIQICFLGLLFPLILFGQNRVQAFREPQRLILGLFVQPAFNQPTTKQTEFYFDNDRYREETGFAISGGIQARYLFDAKWELQMRALIMGKGYRQVLEGPLTIGEINDFSYKIRYVGLPVALRRNLSIGKGEAYVFIGLEPAFFGRASDNQPTERFNPIAVSYLFGLGKEFTVGNEWRVNIEPIFMQAFTALNQFRKYKPITIGLGLGLFYVYDSGPPISSIYP